MTEPYRKRVPPLTGLRIRHFLSQTLIDQQNWHCYCIFLSWRYPKYCVSALIFRACFNSLLDWSVVKINFTPGLHTTRSSIIYGSLIVLFMSLMWWLYRCIYLSKVTNFQSQKFHKLLGIFLYSIAYSIVLLDKKCPLIWSCRNSLPIWLWLIAASWLDNWKQNGHFIPSPWSSLRNTTHRWFISGAHYH